MSEKDKYYGYFTEEAAKQITEWGRTAERNGEIHCEDECGAYVVVTHVDDSLKKMYKEGWGTIRIPGTKIVYLMCAKCVKKNMDIIKERNGIK